MYVYLFQTTCFQINQIKKLRLILPGGNGFILKNFAMQVGTNLTQNP